MFAELDTKQPKLRIQIVCMLASDTWRRAMTFALRAMALVTRYNIFCRGSVLINVPALCRLGARLGTGCPLTGEILGDCTSVGIIFRGQFLEHGNLGVRVCSRQLRKYLQSVCDELWLLAIEPRRGGHLAVAACAVATFATCDNLRLCRRLSF